MAIASTHLTQITNLYVALFDRVPDTAGLYFWADALSKGASLSTITEGFLTAPEGQDTYSAFLDGDDFIATFYTTVFGRAPDAGGLAFWTAALDAAGGAASTVARAQIVAAIVDIVSTPLATQPDDMSDEAYAETVKDRAIFANKVEVGLYYGYALNTPEGDTGGLLDLVDDSARSVQGAKSRAFLDAISSGTADVRGTAADDVFVATYAQLTARADRVVDGAGGNDTLVLLGASDAVPAGATRNIETVELWNTNGTVGVEIDAKAFTGATRITVGDTTGTFALANMGGLTLGLRGTVDGPLPQDATVTGAVFADFGETATHADIALDGSGMVAAGLAGDELEDVTISGRGAVALIAAPTSLKTVEVVSKEGFIQLDVRQVSTIESIDASASTTDVQVAIDGAVNYLGGTGVDTVYIGGGNATGTLDGGAGDQDVLVLGGAASIVTGATVRGFEVLSLTSEAEGSYDTTGFHTVRFDYGLDDLVTLQKLAADATIVIASDLDDDVQVELADDSGKADVLHVALTVTDDGSNGGWLVFDGIATLDVKVSAAAGAGEGARGVINVDSASLRSIVVAGDGQLSLGGFENHALTSVDATALTGDFTFHSANATLGANVTIKGSLTAENSLYGSAANDTLVGGAASDWLYSGRGLDTLTGGDGADSFVLSANANAQIYATITDFGQDDNIELSALFLAGSQAETLTHITLASTATLNDYLAAAAGIAVFGADAESTESAVSWFNFGGNTYLVVDNDAGSASFVNGADTGDQVVKLNGVLDLRDAALYGSVLAFADPLAG